MVALSLISETFFLAICFAEGLISPFFSMLGLIVSGFRAVNMLPTAFVLFAVFGGQYSCTAKYKKCFDKDFFLETIYPYAVFSFMALLDCSLIFLFPWRYSEFAFLAKGYPDMALLRTTQFTKIAQDSARLACNIMYLLYAKDEASDWRVELLTSVNLLASVASILLSGMAVSYTHLRAHETP